MGKNVTAKITGVEARGEVGRVTWTNVRKYWEIHPMLLLVVIVLTLGSPFLGLLLGGWGVLAGLVISVLTLFIGSRAIIRVREETHGQ